MSLRPSNPLAIPEDTAHVAHAAVPCGSSLLSLRDEFGAIFDDQRSAALFAKLSQPAEASWRLALVILLQFMEGLSDRAAADARPLRPDHPRLRTTLRPALLAARPGVAGRCYPGTTDERWRACYGSPATRKSASS